MDCLIRFVPSQREVRVPIGTSLLEAARQAGLPVAQSCTGGAVCGRCGLRVLAGGDGLPPESAGERRAKQRNRIDGGLRLSCLLRLEQDLTVTAPYW
jgi:ferredoxin